MFTGIIKDLGRIKSREKSEKGLVLHIESALEFGIGDSVAVDGVCLTVESCKNGVLQVTAVQETLDRVVFGDEVNLESPLTLQDAVGGHLVLGHVDFVGEVLRKAPDLEISVPDEYLRFMPEKGSVSLNGVSLTIAEVLDDRIRIAIIPETMKVTNLGVVEKVNVEIDMIARYLEKLQK